jgi:uncharacterized membrane protein
MLLELLLGCGLTATNADLTYTKDIRPIFEKRCANCHSSNWPDKNWMDYETAKKNKDRIKFRVENKTMPPGNSTNMTEEERKKVIQWVKDGAKK